jgi:hypothetical protein
MRAIVKPHPGWLSNRTFVEENAVHGEPAGTRTQDHLIKS